jgi:hypothetical protein
MSSSSFGCNVDGVTGEIYINATKVAQFIATLFTLNTPLEVTGPIRITGTTTLSSSLVGLGSGGAAGTLAINIPTGGTIGLNVQGQNYAVVDSGGINVSVGLYAANTKSTIGVTINQGANDDALFSVKSSDVAHGMTAVAETNTYGFMQKNFGGSGGLYIAGLTDADGSARAALSLVGFMGEAADTTHTTAGQGIVEVNALIKSGTGATSPAANSNMFAVRDGSSGATKFIVDEEGDLFADGTLSAYDEHDDVALVRAFDLSHGKGVIKTKWDEFIDSNEQSLVDLGILGATRANGGLVCVTRLQQLHNGAIWQLATQIKEQAVMLHEVNTKLLALEMR